MIDVTPDGTFAASSFLATLSRDGDGRLDALADHLGGQHDPNEGRPS